MSAPHITHAEQVDALIAELEYARKRLNHADSETARWRREAVAARDEAAHYRALVEARNDFDDTLASIREGLL